MPYIECIGNSDVGSSGHFYVAVEEAIAPDELS